MWKTFFFFCFSLEFTSRENFAILLASHKHFLFPVDSFTLASLCFVPATLASRNESLPKKGKARKTLSYETTSGSKKHWKLLWKIIIRIHIANNIMTYSQFSYRTQPFPLLAKWLVEGEGETEKKILHQIVKPWMIARENLAVPEIWGFIKHVFCTAPSHLGAFVSCTVRYAHTHSHLRAALISDDSETMR